MSITGLYLPVKTRNGMQCYHHAVVLNFLQAVYQPEGGILASELCIAAHIKAAQAHGAEFHAPEKVEAWKIDEATGIVTVFTDRGQYSARKLVLTAGSWMPDIMPELQVIFFTQDCRCTPSFCCLLPFLLCKGVHPARSVVR